MIKRDITERVKSIAKRIPIITITGPRQSGKTTLVKNVFPDYKYISLESPDNLDFAINDPKGFLNTYGQKLIIDEAQYAPKLFSYIQTIVDEIKDNGLYILTGSQNFLLSEKISQSLSGRVIILNLLSLSNNEIKKTAFRIKDLPELIVKGLYPRLYDSDISYTDWYPSYIQTYLERDVRNILNVGDINSFRKFLRVCAGRSGQVISLSKIGNDIGVSYQTVKKWLSVLEQSFIVYFLQPLYENFNKRIIKSPKLYFYDTGLVCSLLGINTPEAYNVHNLKGNIFETFIISEILKYKYNFGLTNDFYFWKDSSENEIDLVITEGNNYKAVEIKAGETIKSDFFKTLFFWNKLNPNTNTELNLIYGGSENQKRENVNIYDWKSCTDIFGEK